MSLGYLVSLTFWGEASSTSSGGWYPPEHQLQSSLSLGGSFQYQLRGMVSTWAPASIFTVNSLLPFFVRELEPCVEQYLAIRCSFSQQGTFGVGWHFNTVCWDDLQAVLGVPEGDTLLMRLVKLTGRHTVGGAVGLAMVWAAVVWLPAWGVAGALSSAAGPVTALGWLVVPRASSTSGTSLTSVNSLGSVALMLLGSLGLA